MKTKKQKCEWCSIEKNTTTVYNSQIGMFKNREIQMCVDCIVNNLSEFLIGRLSRDKIQVN